jgi:nucleotidyltransferase/DNA polymerase involved in DNA repair
MKEKTIALVDGNNFFVSCEVFANPSLKNKAVCVLSNNDGCVVSRSYEAKKMGIPMGMPYFMAKRQFPSCIYLSSNFALYHELSQRMMQLLKNYTDIVDVYSIDEAFLDITSIDKIMKLSLYDLATKIKTDVETKIGVSVSVGISCSKILAKLASHKAKKGKGIYIIEKNSINDELKNIEVQELWGVGKNISRSLKKYGIFYANEILLKEDEFFKANYGKKGMELKYELMGNSVIPLTGIVEKPKSIQRTRAFSEFSKDKNYIMKEIKMHLHSVCKKLRENNQRTSLIYVMLRTKDFQVFCKEEKLCSATNSEIILINNVKKLFENLFIDGIIYRSSGVYACDLSEIDNSQQTFFEDTKKKKIEHVSKILDKIEDKYGKGVISVGNSELKKQQK